MILDYEVQHMRGADLDRRIKRLFVKGLLDGTKNPAQLLAAFLAEKIRRFTACRERCSQLSDSRLCMR
jgi:hypothetical protein